MSLNVEQVLAEYLDAVKNRAVGAVSNRPFMSDADWQNATEIVHKLGPLSGAQMLVYTLEHDRFASGHLLDLVLDLEHAYTALALLTKKLDERGDRAMKYRNHYRHCETEWTDEWSCTCNDKCPVCGAEIEPYQSEELNDTGDSNADV